MNAKLKTIVFGGLLVSLMASAGQALAHDVRHDRWHRRQALRQELRGDYRELAEARRQLNYDIAHHKSRRTIARDQQRIDNALNEIRRDRQEFYAWNR